MKAISLLLVCLMGCPLCAQVTVKTGYIVDGLKESENVGSMLIVSAESKPVLRPIGIVTVRSDAANVELICSDKDRKSVAVKRLDASTSLGETRFAVEYVGKVWGDITCIDFPKNIYKRDQIEFEINGRTVEPEPELAGLSADARKVVVAFVQNMAADMETTAAEVKSGKLKTVLDVGTANTKRDLDVRAKFKVDVARLLEPKLGKDVLPQGADKIFSDIANGLEDCEVSFPTGWIDQEHRTPEQQRLHNEILESMPSFGLYGDMPPVGFRILLTDLWKHEKTVEALGRAFTGWLQDTGCCVGVGGANAQQSTLFADKLIRNEPEKPVLVLWPYNYGRSRQLAGMRGRGEGSFGTTYAKSASEDGSPDWEGNNLPTVSIRRGMFSIGGQMEMTWSDGSYAPQEVRAEGKEHKFITAPLSSADQVREALKNGYGVTRAGMVYCNPGTASVQGDVLIGSYNGRGGHQTSYQGYWNHPVHGELFYDMNQWGANVYGNCPSGAAPGGVWIKKATVDAFCRNGEVYALSNYEGYPARPEVFDWATQSLWS